MTAAKGRPLDDDGGLPLGARLYAGELGAPVAVLKASAVEHNAATMASYCASVGALLAPHAKTTMSPELVALQERHGAWAMTAALPWQAARSWEWGTERVLVANEITDGRDLAELLRRRDAFPGRELWFYVDDRRGVEIAAEAVAAAGGAPAAVLVELGYEGGRTGVRGVEAAARLAATVAATPGLQLAGIAGYEGTLATDRSADASVRVSEYLHRLATLARTVAAAGSFSGESPIVTAGGSAWFDDVVRLVGPSAAEIGGRLVLRSGCYLTHDHRMYEQLSPSTSPGWSGPPFLAAIEVWARVVSRPEPGLALINAGRRDLSHDAGLPVPVGWSRCDDGARRSAAGWTVTALGDQHAFVHLPPTAPIGPGDLVGVGISHPCTTFDRWSRFVLVDDDGVATGDIHTEFG